MTPEVGIKYSLIWTVDKDAGKASNAIATFRNHTYVSAGFTLDHGAVRRWLVFLLPGQDSFRTVSKVVSPLTYICCDTIIRTASDVEMC